jgi:hypothetical protein
MANEKLTDRFLIFDTFFYHKLSDNSENGSLDMKLINYKSVKRVKLFLTIK